MPINSFDQTILALEKEVAALKEAKDKAASVFRTVQYTETLSFHIIFGLYTGIHATKIAKVKFTAKNGENMLGTACVQAANDDGRIYTADPLSAGDGTLTFWIDPNAFKNSDYKFTDDTDVNTFVEFDINIPVVFTLTSPATVEITYEDYPWSD